MDSALQMQSWSMMPTTYAATKACAAAPTTAMRSKQGSCATLKRSQGSDSDSDYDEHDHMGGSSYYDDDDGEPKKKVGRKLATDTPVSKRVAQNRMAQRAFRDRREAHLRGLEDKIKELSAIIESRGFSLHSPPPPPTAPSPAVKQLKSMIENLQQENAMLTQIAFGMGSSSVSCASSVSTVKPEVMTTPLDALGRLTPTTECGGQQVGTLWTF
ncbi:hypothetical protein BC830DRAFT_1131460 [Chytriomyces sp. MP71]|nr:hypothetical protein BC830DRAFT_1131460 [Chytriomyces sp. MP71]